MLNGNLWEQIRKASEHALDCGALVPIHTECDIVQDGRVGFMIRIAANLLRKDAARDAETRDKPADPRIRNPFLPYDPDLFVADVSDTHLCLLNKFNVFENHLLIVTRRFEDQELLLSLADFEALWLCMSQYEGLGFYNAGTTAGASQPHKHLQMIPLPMASDGPAVPIEAAFEDLECSAGIHHVPGLHFTHAVAVLEDNLVCDPPRAARVTRELYLAMLGSTGLRSDGAGMQSGAYNLLVTRKWMLLVPRARECFQSISVNSINFAGAHLLRNSAQVELLRRVGPMALLSGVVA